MNLDLASEAKKEERQDMSELEMSLFEYARKEMSSSMITGLPSIAAAKSRARFVWKSAVLVFCAIGFFYQASTFLTYFTSFPTMVDIEIERPREYMVPGFTYCNYNSVRRTAFCQKYPERCYTPDDMKEFCQNYTEFCGYVEKSSGSIDNILVPKPEFYDFEKNISFDELKELGHVFKTFAVSENDTFDLAEVEGPFMVMKHSYAPILCYTENMRIKSSWTHVTVEKKKRRGKPIDIFDFNVEPDEVFRPDRRPGMIFNFHSPFEIEDPIDKGVFLEAGKGYVIRLGIKEQFLLEHPKAHKCLDYISMWERNGRVGPRSKSACIAHCIEEYTVALYNCSSPFIFQRSSGSYCENLNAMLGLRIIDGDIGEDENDIDGEGFFDLKECTSQCRIPCRLLDLPYEIQERFVEESIRGFSEDELTYVVMFIAQPEVITYRHKPAFQETELFSYIGGFLGVWIGVSLVAVADFFESLVRLVCFYIRKRRSAKT